MLTMNVTFLHTIFEYSKFVLCRSVNWTIISNKIITVTEQRTMTVWKWGIINAIITNIQYSKMFGWLTGYRTNTIYRMNESRMLSRLSHSLNVQKCNLTIIGYLWSDTECSVHTEQNVYFEFNRSSLHCVSFCLA